MSDDVAERIEREARIEEELSKLPPEHRDAALGMRNPQPSSAERTEDYVRRETLGADELRARLEMPRRPSPKPPLDEPTMIAQAKAYLELDPDGVLLGELLQNGAEIRIHRDGGIGINRIDGRTADFSYGRDLRAIARILIEAPPRHRGPF